LKLVFPSSTQVICVRLHNSQHNQSENKQTCKKTNTPYQRCRKFNLSRYYRNYRFKAGIKHTIIALKIILNWRIALPTLKNVSMATNLTKLTLLLITKTKHLLCNATLKIALFGYSYYSLNNSYLRAAVRHNSENTCLINVHPERRSKFFWLPGYRKFRNRSAVF
jgi:hypothetical protein